MRNHWDAQSEPYTGGDSLLVLLRQGWQFSGKVVHREYFRIKDRWMTVYYFRLKHKQETQVMCVIHNPYVARLIEEHGLRIRPLDESVKSREGEKFAQL